MDAELRAAYTTLSSATIHEAMGRLGELDSAIGPLWPLARICGPAYPVECLPGDNLMIHHALTEASAGDIIVVATGGAPDCGYWGMITTRAAMSRGIAGLVIDGCVRDSDEIEAIGFPIFCRGRSIRGTSKVGRGRAAVPLSIGGQVISPGDLVVGDRDGLVVVPLDRLDATLRDSRARDLKEIDMVRHIGDGATTAALLGLEERLRGIGPR
jgi:4-hydroxy-4-methyl-2-oxoglutarate aldolase